MNDERISSSMDTGMRSPEPLSGGAGGCSVGVDMRRENYHARGREGDKSSVESNAKSREAVPCFRRGSRDRHVPALWSAEPRRDRDVPLLSRRPAAAVA